MRQQKTKICRLIFLHMEVKILAARKILQSKFLYTQCFQNILYSKFKKYTFIPFFSQILLSHSQQVSVTSDHAVSVVVVIVLGVNFFSFSTSSLKPLHGFASNFVWMLSGFYTYFSWNYG